MKTTFKKFMGVERPIEPKPLPQPKEPHSVPKGYKRVKDGSFNKLVKIDEANFKSLPYSAHMLLGFDRGIYSKHDVMKALLGDLKEKGADDAFNSIANVIITFRKAGKDWPEFDTIEKSLKEDGPLAYSRTMLRGMERGLYSKRDVIRAILADLKQRGPDASGTIASFIDTFRHAGHDWSEFKT